MADGVDWDARYKKGWAYGKAPSSFLVETADTYLRRASSLDILSLGEGQGRNAVYLASLGHRCLSLDTSAVGLGKAAQLAEDRGVRERVETLMASVEAYDVRGRSATFAAPHRSPLPHLTTSYFRALIERSCARCLRSRSPALSGGTPSSQFSARYRHRSGNASTARARPRSAPAGW
eukprot:564803-Prymnesium_polylepis.1